MKARKRAPGGGRKTVDKGSYSKLRTYSVVLDVPTVRHLKALGRGSVSAGVRMLTAKHVAQVKETGK